MTAYYNTPNRNWFNQGNQTVVNTDLDWTEFGQTMFFDIPESDVNLIVLRFNNRGVGRTSIGKIKFFGPSSNTSLHQTDVHEV